MLKNFGLLAISCFMCLSNAEAQVFHVQRTGESVKTTVAEPIKTQTETVAKVRIPTEATPEQIIAAQAPLMKKLKYASQKYEPSELRGIVDALNRYSEVQVRRENLSLPSDQQIEFKKDNVDVHNAKAVEKYFNEKLLPQTDDDPEKETADGTAGKQ